MCSTLYQCCGDRPDRLERSPVFQYKCSRTLDFLRLQSLHRMRHFGILSSRQKLMVMLGASARKLLQHIIEVILPKKCTACYLATIIHDSSTNLVFILFDCNRTDRNRNLQYNFVNWTKSKTQNEQQQPFDVDRNEQILYLGKTRTTIRFSETSKADIDNYQKMVNTFKNYVRKN